jgi:hypothetical protein
MPRNVVSSSCPETPEPFVELTRMRNRVKLSDPPGEALPIEADGIRAPFIANVLRVDNLSEIFHFYYGAIRAGWRTSLPTSDFAEWPNCSRSGRLQRAKPGHPFSPCQTEPLDGIDPRIRYFAGNLPDYRDLYREGEFFVQLPKPRGMVPMSSYEHAGI